MLTWWTSPEFDEGVDLSGFDAAAAAAAAAAADDDDDDECWQARDTR
jgi:hypothetical protein